MKILTLIPARSGSKGIRHKNIRKLNGKPLIAYSIEQVLESKYRNFMKVIVTSDSEEYLKIAEKYGSGTILRPNSISLDNSLDIEFVKHSLEYLKINQKYIPDIILHVRPTYPLRKISDIDNCLDIFIKKRNVFDSLRSITLSKKPPHKMYYIENNCLKPFFKKFYEIEEPYNIPRQSFPNSYVHNGCIDIFNTNLVEKETISGDKIIPYIMDDYDLDIDNEEDWIKVEEILKKYNNSK